MASRLTPEEAARALRDVDQRTDQALQLLVGPRWLYAGFGVLLFAWLASYDFFTRDVSSMLQWTVLGALLVYWALMENRAGSRYVGQSVRHHRQALSPTVLRWGRVAPIAVLAVGVALQFAGVRVPMHLPYWHTALGALLGVALGGYGPWLQRRMIAAAKRPPHRPEAGTGVAR